MSDEIMIVTKRKILWDRGDTPVPPADLKTDSYKMELPAAAEEALQSGQTPQTDVIGLSFDEGQPGIPGPIVTYHPDIRTLGQAVISNEAICAIKSIRAQLNISLKVAKDLYDEHREKWFYALKGYSQPKVNVESMFPGLSLNVGIPGVIGSIRMGGSGAMTLREAILEKDMIAAIKSVRAQLDIGLKEAKDLYDLNKDVWYATLLGVKTVIETKIIPDRDYGLAPTKKNGNGHKSQMKRKLVDAERDAIRAEFVKHNGCAEDDHWVVFRKSALSIDVAIFQVTGFVSYLHRDIASGGKTAKQVHIPSYLTWLKGKYKMWALYNSPKYEGYRQEKAGNTAEIPVTESESESPKFATGFPKDLKYA